jgi:hypothetical protein
MTYKSAAAANMDLTLGLHENYARERIYKCCKMLHIFRYTCAHIITF